MKACKSGCNGNSNSQTEENTTSKDSCGGCGHKGK